MNISAFSAAAPPIGRLQGLVPAAAPAAHAQAAGPAQWLLADDGVGDALLAAGPRSARLSIEELERQFLHALIRPATDAG